MLVLVEYPLLGFGFGNLIALGWLAAAAAPILIHLWMRQTHRTTSWAAYQFLRSALERQARRLKIQHWILLAIRTAILLLIALAAAKPFFDNGLLTGGVAPLHRILVIDNSLSMGFFEDSTNTRIDRSISAAESIIKLGNSDDRFSVVYSSEKASSNQDLIGIDKTTVLSAVAEVVVTPSKSSTVSTLRNLENLVSQTKSDPTLPDEVEIIFFTDLLNKDWQSFCDNVNPESNSLLEKIDAQASIKLVDVGSSKSENFSITSFLCTNRLPTAGQVLDFSALIEGFETGDRNDISVELVIDGLSIDRQTCQIGDEPLEVLFSTKIDSPGVHSATLRIRQDSLLADNERHLALNLKETLKILCVEGRPRSARHVSDALNPRQDNSFPLQPEIVSHSDLSSIDLDRFDCAIFCNVSEFSQNEILQIKQFCRHGGGAIFFLGDQVIPDRYEGILSNEERILGRSNVLKIHPVSLSSIDNRSSKPLLPLSMQGLIRVSSGIDPLEYHHPIVQPFKGNERSGLLSTPVSRIHSLRINPSETDSDTQVALATSSGDPLLITTRYGAGRIAVMATDCSLQSIDPETGEPWTALPAWPSFLPMLRGMVEAVLNLSDEIGSHEVGQEISAVSSSRLSVVRPDQTEELLEQLSSESVVYSRTDQLGFYDFIDETKDPIMRRAINPSPQESNTLRAVSESLDPRFEVINLDSFSNSSSLSPDGNHAIHQNLLILALLLLLIESGIACWFGRGRA